MFSSFFKQPPEQTLVISSAPIKPATTFQKVQNECIETLWLKSILYLDHSELGIGTEAEANRFKALMILLFHEQIKIYQPSRDSLNNLVKNIVINASRNFTSYAIKAYLFDHPLKKLLRDHDLSNEERSQRFEVIFDKMIRDIFGDIYNFLEIQRHLFLESDQINVREIFLDPMLLLMRRVMMLLCGITPPPAANAIDKTGDEKSETDEQQLTVIDSISNHNTDSMESQLNDLLEELKKLTNRILIELVKKVILVQTENFNFESIRKINELGKPEQIQKVRNLAKVLKFKKINALLDKQKEFISSHSKFLAIYEETCNIIKHQYALFSEESFQTSYMKAFSIFKSDQKQSTFLLSYIYELYLAQTVYPCFQMEILENIDSLGKAVDISLDQIVELKKSRKHTELFLHDILAWASSAWKTGASPYSNNEEMNENLSLSYPSNQLTLFSNNADRAGGMTTAHTDILIACPEWIEHYKTILTEDKKIIPATEISLERYFRSKLDIVDSLPQIAALSYIIRKENTKIWKRMENRLEKKANAIMKISLGSDMITDKEKLELIDAWKKHPLFKGFFNQRQLEHERNTLIRKLEDRSLPLLKMG